MPIPQGYPVYPPMLPGGMRPPMYAMYPPEMMGYMMPWDPNMPVEGEEAVEEDDSAEPPAE